MKAFAYDYETTGIDTKTCGVVQVAFCYLELNDDGSYSILDQDVTYLNPRQQIPHGAYTVHGISNEMVEYAPDYEMYLTTEMGILNNSDVSMIIGYNHINYDNKISHRFGMGDTFSQLDMMVLGKEMKARGLVPNAKLGTVYEKVTGKKPDGVHDALADITMTLSLIPYAMELYKVNSVSELVDAFNNTKKEKPFTVPFGKYKGLMVKDLPLDYVSWMRKNIAMTGKLLEEVNTHFPQ